MPPPMTVLKLLRFLMTRSRGLSVSLISAGALSGAASAGVLALINRALHHPDGVTAVLVGGFVALVVCKVLSVAASQLLLARFSQTNILELSLDLCAKILKAPLRLIEQRGEARILANLTDDVSSIAWAVQCLPQLAMNTAIVLSCGAYLAWLSWQMVTAALGVAAVGIAIYRLLHTRAVAALHDARETRSHLFTHFRSLTRGIKELMLHRDRRNEFLSDHVHVTANEYRSNNLLATVQYAYADAWITVLYFSLIGLCVFAFPLIFETSSEVITGYAFAMLYMMSPLWSIINALPAMAQGQVALEKVENLGMSIDRDTLQARDAGALGTGDDRIDDVELDGIEFSYEAGSDGTEAPFKLGPLNFRLGRGELVFVVGGNGSGKSTFAKILTGLYWPSAGVVKLNGKPVPVDCQEDYRQQFSAVFSDFHLFEQLLGLMTPEVDARARRYLQVLQLDRKVKLNGGRLSTIDLSQGQRKRLALLTAYLEDRPFYVFDEWAADQDPEYKEIFYSKVLPELRERGKGVVVITHDDRYFDMGDRIVRLEDGRASEAAADVRVRRAVRPAAPTTELA